MVTIQLLQWLYIMKLFHAHVLLYTYEKIIMKFYHFHESSSFMIRALATKSGVLRALATYDVLICAFTSFFF